MNIKPSKTLVKQSLEGHKWIGLSVGLLMYLICLSGTIVVFFEEFERWEQPKVSEYLQYSPNQISTAVDNFLAKVDKTPKSIYVVLPTEAVPRIHVSGDGKEWFVGADGRLEEPVKEGWTHMLKGLHVNLHLPITFGIIIVGALGAMLVGLIISGLLAHPRIFKDAFTFRRGGSERLEQADLHNRLSVWGTPFYFMIGLTGAYIGLVGVIIATIAPADFNGDRDAVVSAVYGGDPIVNQAPHSIDFAAAFENLASKNSEAKPIYLVLQNLGTSEQFLEIAATLPQRLIYSEMYRFKSDGGFIDYQQLSDGEVGRQVAYSVYRLHFGHFDSGWVKIIYAVLGIALTVISVSGINIWLARRKHKSFLNGTWVAAVWGAPLGLALAFFLGMLFGISTTGIFWLTLILSMAVGALVKKVWKISFHLKWMTAIVLLLNLLVYYLEYDSFSDNDAALKVNGGIVLLIIYYGLSTVRSRQNISKKLNEANKNDPVYV